MGERGRGKPHRPFEQMQVNTHRLAAVVDDAPRRLLAPMPIDDDIAAMNVRDIDVTMNRN